MRFSLPSTLRATAVVLCAATISACEIEGNGITSIEIVNSTDGSTNFTMRKDHCEGLQIDTVARFTDDQLFNYTRRTTWEATSDNIRLDLTILNADDNDPDNDIVAAVHVVPTEAVSAGDTATVTAVYESLRDEITITFSDESIDHLLVTPSFIEVISGQSQAIGTTLITSENNVISNNRLGLALSLSNSDAFTIDDESSLVLNSVESLPGDSAEAELQVEVCGHIPSFAQSRTVRAINYNPSGALAPTLQLATAVDGEKTENDITIPVGVSANVIAELLFAGGTLTNVSTVAGNRDPSQNNGVLGANTDWSISGASNDDVLTLAQGLGAYTITSNDSITGSATVNATFTSVNGETFSDSINVDVASLRYQDDTQPIVVRDEIGQIVDTTISPAFNVANLTTRRPRYLAALQDDSNQPYEVAVAPALAVVGEESLIASSAGLVGALAHLADAPVMLGDSKTVSVTTDFSSFDENIGSSITNNVQSFDVLISAAKSSGLGVDINTDNVPDANAQIATIGEHLQLRSLLQFQGLTPIDLSQSTVWISDDPSVAAVDSIGLVTATGNGSTTITAIQTYSYADGLDSDNEPNFERESLTTTITINVGP